MSSSIATEKSIAENLVVLPQMTEMGHEQIVFCNDNNTGLKSIIGIHNTTLGPALGGTRVWAYTSEVEALRDVLRLSRGMTYKSAISGINLGGGKAVIIADPKTKKGEAFWRRYGKFVNSLGGKYITAEDVGTSPGDMVHIAMETKHVAGKPAYLGGTGDPSPVTAYGVFLGIKASVKELTGSDDLTGKTVSVQGVGHVGQYLVEHLCKAGAEVTICDINENNIKLVCDKNKVNVVAPEDIYKVNSLIYAPCALGATVNDRSLSVLKCAIIAGAANNQLEDEVKHGNYLLEKGIIYAPDFLINAGGVINCYTEVIGVNRDMAVGLTENIYAKTLEIFKTSKEQNITTQKAAMLLAEQRIEQVAKIKAVL
ncbi:MAG: Glu/Leu/Phe/Val dehydrogenase [Bacteroidota bacterium]